MLPKLLKTICLSCFIFIYIDAVAQIPSDNFQYEPSINAPFGKLNPTAPSQVGDFDKIIGICDCKSLQRNADGTWQDTTTMVWKFKYIMNGTAVQDEVWRDGNYAGSIRQYQKDSAVWIVTYFSYPAVATAPGVWKGTTTDKGNIILYQNQQAPNGMDGFSKLTFSNISEKGFTWNGEWVNVGETFSYPFWQIWCTKRH